MRLMKTVPVIVAFAALAADARADLFVSDFTGNSISRVDSSGAVSTPITGASSPIGLAIGPNGNLFAAVSGGVSEYTLGGALVGSFSGGGLRSKTGLAFDGIGNLYVANASPGEVVEFSPTTPGGSTYQFTSTFTAMSSVLSTPIGIAFDPATGDLYVANAGTINPSSPATDTVAVFSAVGTYLGSLSGFSAPTGIAFDGLGHAYVSNYSLGTISEISVPTVFAGATIPATVIGTLSLPGGAGPAGLAFGPGGDLFVAGEASSSGSIYEFASTGPGSFSRDSSTFATGLQGPYFLASQPAITATPEPGTMAMLASAVPIGVVAWMRRRKRT